MKRMTPTAVAFTCGLGIAAVLPQSAAYASDWEVRQEIREGHREVQCEKREARQEIRRCKTKNARAASSGQVQRLLEEKCYENRIPDSFHGRRHDRGCVRGKWCR